MNIFFQDIAVGLVLGSLALFAIAGYIAVAFWLKSKKMGMTSSRGAFSALVFYC